MTDHKISGGPLLRRLRKTGKRIAIPVLLLTGGFAGFAAADKSDDHLFEISKNMEIFGTLFKQLNKLYVDEPKPGALMKTGIDAMLSSLDPYTNYISEEEIEEYRYESSGRYGGIGAQVRQIGDRYVISEPYDNFPAQKAGIKAGDVLIEINGKACKGKSYEELGKELKGIPNTSVKIKIERAGEPRPLEFNLVREEIKVKNVTYHNLLEGNVGYIRLDGFMENAAVEVRDALLDLKQRGATSLVLDVRENPGGLLREAVAIVNLFVDKDQVVVDMRGRVKEWDKTYRSENTPVDTQIPLVVLVNSWSASASEIVAGALQDMDRAVVVGQRSFGKGLVQQTLPLVYGSLFKVTVAKYYTPSGRCVQSVDYSHRRADGTLERVPDSLITAYKTKNGRIVWDGLGVIPDVEVPARQFSVLADTLIIKGLIFDYATVYVNEHPSIDKSDKFRLSDEEYNAFVNWVKSKDHSFITKEEKDLVAFKTHSGKQGHFTAVSAEYETLLKKVQSEKADDFAEFKTEIRVLLESEISSRYYYQSGRVAASLKDDPDLKQALTIIRDKKAYNGILTTVLPKEKPKQRVDLEKKEG
ncbi:MAG TPA: S41 family peptidase [Bacteroidia bacterium]|nr:S41 family peptidase [Bacteroidia bacterium]